MSKEQMTKREALQLVTAIIDGETGEGTRQKFFKFIENNNHVRRKYESEKRIKKLVSTRCSYHRAPESLKMKIHRAIETKSTRENGKEETVYRDHPTRGINPRKEEEIKSHFILNPGWIYAAAATLLVVAAFWGLIFYGQETGKFYQLEEYVYQHFMNHNGELVPPTFETASVASAEIKLSSEFDYLMTVPPIKEAEFKGVALSDFVPEYRSPLLEYYLPEEDQYIYIFAFDINQLNTYKKLVRSEDAVKKCLGPQDFHVQEINGKHVVSWKWAGTWYAAISHREGKELASLVEPLNYKPEN